MQQLIEFVGNHYLLAAGWAALAAMLIYSFVSGALSPVKELSTHDVTLLINKEDAVLIDIRQTAEYKKGHVLGAQLLKQEQVNKADFSSLEKYKDKPIVLVCAMGMNAKGVAAKMLKAGFTQVSVLKGGMNAWQSANLPVSK